VALSAKTQQALRDAMERLLSGQPQHTTYGKLTKNNLCREAGVCRATMNRATEILTEWDARTATSPAGTPCNTSTPRNSPSSAASCARAARSATPFRNRLMRRPP
jgi:hypothetical protein